MVARLLTLIAGVSLINLAVVVKVHSSALSYRGSSAQGTVSSTRTY